MYDSILISVKKLLGIAEDYNYFNPDLILCINTVLMVLRQMGVGSGDVSIIEDDTTVWKDFCGDTVTDIEGVKNYTALKVRMMFDPPQSSALATAFNENIKELEWRLYSAESSGNFDLDKIDELYADYGAENIATRRKHFRRRIEEDYGTTTVIVY